MIFWMSLACWLIQPNDMIVTNKFYHINYQTIKIDFFRAQNKLWFFVPYLLEELLELVSEPLSTLSEGLVYLKVDRRSTLIQRPQNGVFLAIDKMVWLLLLKSPASLITTRIEIFPKIEVYSHFYLSMGACVSEGEIVALGEAGGVKTRVIWS